MPLRTKECAHNLTQVSMHSQLKTLHTKYNNNASHVFGAEPDAWFIVNQNSLSFGNAGTLIIERLS